MIYILVVVMGTKLYAFTKTQRTVYLKRWIILYENYTSYLLLSNKVSQNLVAYSNKHLLSHNFCGSEMQAQVPLAQSLSHKAAPQVLDWYSHLKVQWG